MSFADSHRVGTRCLIGALCTQTSTKADRHEQREAADVLFWSCCRAHVGDFLQDVGHLGNGAATSYRDFHRAVEAALGQQVYSSSAAHAPGATNQQDLHWQRAARVRAHFAGFCNCSCNVHGCSMRAQCTPASLSMRWLRLCGGVSPCACVHVLTERVATADALSAYIARRQPFNLEDSQPVTLPLSVATRRLLACARDVTWTAQALPRFDLALGLA